jgi:hypothetical protein
LTINVERLKEEKDEKRKESKTDRQAEIRENMLGNI